MTDHIATIAAFVSEYEVLRYRDELKLQDALTEELQHALSMRWYEIGQKRGKQK